MLKKSTLELINDKNNFKEVFSVCIGISYLYQERFIKYIGKYSRWDTDVTEGYLNLDDKTYDVEYIGTTADGDNYWYSADVEKVIPEKYVQTIVAVKDKMKKLGFDNLSKSKIELTEKNMGYKLSMIYLAMCEENVAYFCGSGQPFIYMFVKNIPDTIFESMKSSEISGIILEIISIFDVDHRIMVKALLNESGCTYEEKADSMTVNLPNGSLFNIYFENDILATIEGNL